jgi:hypothetical protein
MPKKEPVRGIRQNPAVQNQRFVTQLVSTEKLSTGFRGVEGGRQKAAFLALLPEMENPRFRPISDTAK